MMIMRRINQEGEGVLQKCKEDNFDKLESPDDRVEMKLVH